MSNKQYKLMSDDSRPETFHDYDPEQPVTGARIGETVFFDERAPWMPEDKVDEPAVKQTRTVRTGYLAIMIALVFALVNLAVESMLPTRWYVWAASSPVYILATYIWLVRRVNSSSS